jgi:molybdate transport system ATP-binding protein
LHVDIRKRLAADHSGSFFLNVTFAAKDGITILFGPSGSGKTSTLRAIAGILKPEEGRISIGDRVYFDSKTGTDLPIQQRRVGYVFQDYALFPHLTAEQNVAYGIKDQKDHARRERAASMLSLFKVDHVRHRYPVNMSGGEQQRIALARALASDPAVVLLDEPLSAVDMETRAGLLDEVAAAQQSVGIPFLYVTHNPDEAVRLGARVVVLSAGSVSSVGPTAEIFQKKTEENHQ